MQCPMCRSEETKWENVDKFRIKPEGMAMCTNCGFISYPQKYKTKEEILNYYETDYRAPPQMGNLYTGERKLHYHAKMLNETFEKWAKEKKNDPVVTDIGAAFGMFLDWVRFKFKDAKLHGVELTKSFVRNAWYLYNIKLDKDFNDSIEYDLISSYKSLEHILDPDVELRRYIKALKEDGVLYLSVPIWFRTMSNFGTGGWSIEYYYHPNHINVWNLNQFEALIKVCGGEVVKADHNIYESSYIIKRNDDLLTDDRSSLLQDTKKIKECLKQIFNANECFETGNYLKAIEQWSNFPYAHQVHYENNRKKIHELGFDKIYNEVCLKAIENCPHEADMHVLAADICARYDQYDKCIEHLNKANDMRPGMPNVYLLTANAYRTLAERSKNPQDKVKYIEQARETTLALKAVSSQLNVEATNSLMIDNSKLPTPFEA